MVEIPISEIEQQGISAIFEMTRQEPVKLRYGDEMIFMISSTFLIGLLLAKKV
ncbi:MAG: hypothetical protein R2880_05410 [Deinococcales bacterium]